MSASAYAPTVSAPHYSDSTADGSTVKTDTIPATTKALYIQCQTNGIWFTLDGTTPSDTNGLFVPAAALPLFLPVAGFAALKWLASAAGGAKVDILHLA